MDSLQHLSSKTLVHVAGRLIPPAPAVEDIEWDGSRVPVSNAMIRSGNDLISVGFFRELSRMPTELTMGAVYLLQKACTHQKTTGGGRVVIQLRAGKDARVVAAPAALAQHIAAPPSWRGMDQPVVTCAHSDPTPSSDADRGAPDLRVTRGRRCGRKCVLSTRTLRRRRPRSIYATPDGAGPRRLHARPPRDDLWPGLPPTPAPPIARKTPP